MEIFELAAELGRTLKKDKRLTRLDEARQAYEADEEIRRLATEYEVQQKALGEEVVREERNEEAINAIQARIDEIYKTITESAPYLALEAAQKEVNELMEMVNNTITAQISGGTSEGCTHNCATCGGCH